MSMKLINATVTDQQLKVSSGENRAAKVMVVVVVQQTTHLLNDWLAAGLL